MSENRKENIFDVVVCGSGPAGLASALASAESGAKTLLVEKQSNLSAKLLASGGTRCNFSNALPDKEFMASFGRNGRFMNDALLHTTNDWILDFLALRGVKAVAEDGFHYFPADGKSSSVRDAFLDAALETGRLTVRKNAKIIRIDRNNGKVTGVSYDIDGRCENVSCRAFVLASGGTAMPSLGGSDSGLKLASSCGHTIIPVHGAMAPLILKEAWLHDLSGVSLSNGAISFGSGRKRVSYSGEILFTKTGLSGFPVLDVSGQANRAFAEDGSLTLYLAFSSGVTSDGWKKKIDGMKTEYPAKQLSTVLGYLFTKSIGDTVCRTCGAENTVLAKLSNSVRDEVADFLAGAPVTMEKETPSALSMAMAGGVSLKEIEPRTFMSKLVPGLFFAGEVVDLDGPCGGYNIRFALSSGRLAGHKAAEYARHSAV